MIPIEVWLKSNKKPILLLGKGPSFSKRRYLLLENYTTIALNHSIREQKCTISHLIDFDVFESCQNEIYNNCEILVIPWCPHIKFLGTNKTLTDFAREYPILQKMIDEGRVYSYNLSTGQVRSPGFRGVVPSGFFSGDTVYSMLTTFGVKEVRALGIDGSTHYDPAFSDLTPLAGGHKTFDKQFDNIAKISKTKGSTFINMGTYEPLEIYIGATERQMIPAKVLDYTIKKNTTNLTSVTPLCGVVSHDAPKDLKNKPRTPFSFQRFCIPSITKNKAMYLDSDMLVFDDISKLFEIEFDGCEMITVGMDSKEGWKTSDYAVLLIDCKNITWSIHDIVKKLDSGELTYESLMFEFKITTVNKTLPSKWNCLDKYDSETSLLHYTRMDQQPWLKPGHPLEHLWVSQLKEAIDCGFLSKSLVMSHQKDGYIRAFI